MRERTWLLLISSVLVVGFLAIKFLVPEQPKVGPIEIKVRDTNYYMLPYVRVEIENLERGYKSEAQNFGQFLDGPFFEGKHRVVVKLGEEPSGMNQVVYDKVHNFTKGMKTLDIRLDNVIQRFDIGVAGRETVIPVLPYKDRKDIVIGPYKESGQ